MECGSGQHRAGQATKAAATSLRCVWMDSVRGPSIAGLGMGVGASSSCSLCCWGALPCPIPEQSRDQSRHRCALLCGSCRAPTAQLLQFTIPACVHAAHMHPLLQEWVPRRAGRSNHRPLTCWVLHSVPWQPFLGCWAWFVSSVWVDARTISIQRCEVVGWWQWPSGTLKTSHQGT